MDEETALSPTPSSNIDETDPVPGALLTVNALGTSSVICESHEDVKWSCGKWEVDRGLLFFVGTYVLLFTVCLTALANLTFTSEIREVWVSLVTLIVGLFLDKPDAKSKSKEGEPQRLDIQQ